MGASPGYSGKDSLIVRPPSAPEREFFDISRHEPSRHLKETISRVTPF